MGAEEGSDQVSCTPNRDTSNGWALSVLFTQNGVGGALEWACNCCNTKYTHTSIVLLVFIFCLRRGFRFLEGFCWERFSRRCCGGGPTGPEEGWQRWRRWRRRKQLEEGVCAHVTRGPSRMTVDPRIAQNSGTEHVGFHRPGNHHQHQARSAEEAPRGIWRVAFCGRGNIWGSDG